MKKVFFFSKINCALLLLLILSSRASGQYFASYNPNEELFKYEVKVIEEFMERFNDDPNSFLRNAYKKENKQYNITKTNLVISLFNLENMSLSADTALNDFFRQVLSPTPPRLSFKDSNWYAEAKCVFLYQNRQVELPLIFRIKNMKNEGSKWMIAGIGDTISAHNPLSPIPPKIKGKDNFISTTAHATNFVELHNIFLAGMNPEYFFEPELIVSEKGKAFISLIMSDKIQFQYARSISYHFFEVPGWIFEVQQFERKTRNNGWLISQVKKLPDTEKEKYKMQLLHR